MGGEEELRELVRELRRARWAYGLYGGLILWGTVVVIGFGIGFMEMLRAMGTYALGFLIGLGTGLAVAVATSTIVYLAMRGEKRVIREKPTQEEPYQVDTA
mgnify:CR=1 FL=1